MNRVLLTPVLRPGAVQKWHSLLRYFFGGSAWRYSWTLRDGSDCEVICVSGMTSGPVHDRRYTGPEEAMRNC